MADREPNWSGMKTVLILMAVAIPLNMTVAARDYGWLAALNVLGLFCMGMVAGTFITQLRGRSTLPK